LTEKFTQKSCGKPGCFCGKPCGKSCGKLRQSVEFKNINSQPVENSPILSTGFPQVPDKSKHYSARLLKFFPQFPQPLL
jgi:hypothetical protein